MTVSPLPQFVQSIQALLRYWRQYTLDLDGSRLEKLDNERQNLYRVVQFGLKRIEAWPDVAWVALQSIRLIEQRGYWREWIPILDEAIRLCEEKELELKFNLLNQLGQLYRSDGQILNALQVHEKALELAQLLENTLLLADASLHLSIDYWRNREYDASKHFGLMALTGFRGAVDAQLKVASALTILGLIAYREGSFSEAEEHLEEATIIYRQTGEVLQLARSLNNLAMVLQAQKKYDLALERYRETAVLLEPTSYLTTKVAIWVSWGSLYFELGQLNEAEAIFRRANAPEVQSSVEVFNRASAANNLASVLTQKGDLEEAERFLKNAISLWKQIDETVELAISFGNLAEVYQKLGRWETAVQFYQDAITLLQGFPNDARATQICQKYVQKLTDSPH